MIALASGIRVYLACGTTDMRKGMTGLAMLVQQGLAADCQTASNIDPLSGVRPLGWTESSYCFDRLPGVLIFELRGAEIAQGRV